MSKANKKKQIEELQTIVAAQWRQINKLKLHLGRLVDIDWSDEQANHDEVIAILNNEQPKPKTLDQSVFDGLDREWQWAAIDKNSKAWRYREKPYVDDGYALWLSDSTEPMKIGEGYDASNWKDSLIERSDIAKELLEVDLSSELKGSDLARAMLELGDKYVLCFVSDFSDDRAVAQANMINLMTHTKGDCFYAKSARWKFAVPLNQQTGEPLTASEVGL